MNTKSRRELRLESLELRRMLAPVIFDGTGYYYDFVPGAFTWDGAQAEAQALTHLGLPGHLATITSAEENQFIRSTFSTQANEFKGPWIGATWNGQGNGPTEGWSWITDEEFSFTAWNQGEPTQGPEDAIHFSEGGWNDVAKSRLDINGFFVEYEPSAADLIASDIKFAESGIEFSYLLVGSQLPLETNAVIHWASGTTASDILAPAAEPIRIPVTTPLGSTVTVAVSQAELEPRPPGTTHVQIALDPDNLVDEGANEGNNARAARLPGADPGTAPIAVADNFEVAEDSTLVVDATPRSSVEVVSQRASDIVYHPSQNVIYALDGQNLVPINANTADVGDSIRIGGTPTEMVISDDGQFIYLVTNTKRRIKQYNTETQQVDFEWTIDSGLEIGDIEAVPGRPTFVVIAQYYTCCSPRQGGVIAYENGRELPRSTAGGLGTSGGGDSLAFADESTLVGYTNSLSSYDLTIMRVDETGVRVTNSGIGGRLSGNTEISGGGGYIFSDHGIVVDIGSLNALGRFSVHEDVLADGERAFILHGEGTSTRITWYDVESQDQLGRMSVPEVRTGDVMDLIHAGEGRLAFRTSGSKVVIVQNDELSDIVRKGVLTNDFDPAGAELSARLISGPQNGELTWNGDGTFSYTPDADYSGMDAFTYVASDGTEESAPTQVSITVTPVNDEPNRVADAYTAQEDFLLSVSAADGVLANDSDKEGDSLTAQLVVPPLHGTVELREDGSFDYQPDQDFHGFDVFSYRAFDGTDYSDEAIVTISVAELEDVPSPVDDVYFVNEDESLSVDGSGYISVRRINQVTGDLAYDAAQDRLLVTVPDFGSQFVDSLIEFDPYTGNRMQLASVASSPGEIVLSDDGQFLFMVVQDGRAIQVYDVANNMLDEPFLMPGSGRTGERVRTIHAIPGEPERVLVTRYFPEWSPSAAGTWVYTKDGNTLPRHDGEGLGTGGADISTVDETGTVGYGYNNNNSGFDFWIYKIDDSGVRSTDVLPGGTVLSGYDVYNIKTAGGRLFTNRGEVIDLDSKEPIATFAGGDNFLLDTDSGHLYSVASDGIDATMFVYDLTSLELLRTVDLPGVSGLTGSLHRFGSDGIAFRSLAFDTWHLNLVQSSIVSGVNPGGVLDNDRDVDEGGFEVMLASDVEHGNLRLNADGSFVYHPDPEFSGEDSFRYRLKFADGDSDPATVRLVVRDVNDIPTARPDTYSVDEDTLLAVDVDSGLLANDSDTEGDELTIEITEGGTKGSIDINPDGSFTYRPFGDFFGRDRFKYRAVDGNGASEPVTVDIHVNPVPDPTLARNDVYTVDQGRVLVADSPVEVSTEPTERTLVPLAGSWRYLDDGSNQGTLWRHVNYDDADWSVGEAPLGYGQGDEETITDFGDDSFDKHVTTYFRTEFDAGEARFSDLTLSLRRDDGVAVYLNGFEIYRDGLVDNAPFDELAFDVASDDGQRFLEVSVDPNLLREGSNSLAAEVHQASRQSSDLTFQASLIGVIPASPRIAGVLANDADPDGKPITAVIDEPPAHGELVIHADGTFEYVPIPTFFGLDQFTYQVDDGDGPVSIGSVIIQIRQANVTPITNPDVYRLPLGADLRVDSASGVLANDSDIEDATLRAVLVTPPEHGDLTLHADGSFTYVAGPTFRLADVFTYTASDGELVSSETSVTIRIDAPEIQVGHHFLKPNTPNQSISIFVSGGQSVAGVNLFAQVGDGGPERINLGLPAGTDGPAISSIDLKSDTIFSSVPDVPFFDLAIPQIAYGTIAIQQPDTFVVADGLLATLVVDTTGFFAGTFDLLLGDVLPNSPDGALHSDFASLPIDITNGSIEIAETRVVGRHVFYNNSKYDGGKADADSLDDLAIASDKSALLPGQQATFSNYTSYSRGINGVILDVQHFLGTPRLSDFQFRVGNNNDPTSWAPAADPSNIAVRRGEAENETDRITLTWPDNAIQNQWLEIRVIANENTGLVNDDVFYFGNAIGETGNDASNALVNASDILGARDNPRGPFNLADIESRFDFNRDRTVTATDMLLARDHLTSPLSALRLITPQVSNAAVAQNGLAVDFAIAEVADNRLKIEGFRRNQVERMAEAKQLLGDVPRPHRKHVDAVFLIEQHPARRNLVREGWTTLKKTNSSGPEESDEVDRVKRCAFVV